MVYFFVIGNIDDRQSKPCMIISENLVAANFTTWQFRPRNFSDILAESLVVAVV